jgi:hypothetical protein
MTGPPRAPAASPTPAWTCLYVVAIAVGAFLRVDQFGTQVLIDDEWHAVHQILRRGPGALFLDFGFSDYSIPLGIYDWTLAWCCGLTETAMRLPMLLAGLATLVLFPLYIARRFSWPVATVFATLLAISPLLILYSRMARPYALTLLFSWTAQVAFQRHVAGARGSAWGITYCMATTLATWLHPIVAPFVLAPFLLATMRLRTLTTGERHTHWRRLAQIAVPTATAISLLLLPPLLANPISMTLKGGVDAPTLATLVGVWYAWLGTPSTAVVLGCLALATVGAGTVWRTLPEGRAALLGIALTLLAIVASRPMWSFVPLTVARYLLPFLPLLLLAVTVGAAGLAAWWVSWLPGIGRPLRTMVALLPCLALASQSPLAPTLRRPNAQTLHLAYHFDFRPERNAYLPQMATIPLSPFWRELGARAPGSTRVAVAPFYFESYDWDAPRWEEQSGQTVVPGFLTGLCVEQRWGEVPPDRRYTLRNAVHLGDRPQLIARGIEFVVWQKPYLQMRNGRAVPIGGDTAWCERIVAQTFGPPVFEDDTIMVFHVATAHVAR